jgi:hypothetical protein
MVKVLVRANGETLAKVGNQTVNKAGFPGNCQVVNVESNSPLKLALVEREV